MSEQKKKELNQADSRRRFLQIAGFGAAAGMLGGQASQALAQTCTPPSTNVMVAPGEDKLHARTWMAWPSSTAIWGNLLGGVQADVALIAYTIAKYEPVILCADGSYNASVARYEVGSSVTVISDIPVNDLWARDTACLFRVNAAGSHDAVGLNFNGWGNKQTYTKDGYVAEAIAYKAGVPFSHADFVSEPGAIEQDGEGTLIATESSIVNANRNPGKTKAQLEAAMMAAYGATKVIWVPGVVGKDITDDHIDATSRFVRPGVVMVQVAPDSNTTVWGIDSRQQFAILSNAVDAKGRKLQVIKVSPATNPRVKTPDFLNSYMNFYVCNGAVISAQFGDAAADAAAKAALQAAFPGRVVEMLNLDRLYGGGGGVHCSTQQEPIA
ncbi:MAG: agmatine deiminase family protein [Burkholderiales bacterium]|nr:agmatine deiminase family protein [Burkholderiales bacterium]